MRCAWIKTGFGAALGMGLALLAASPVIAQTAAENLKTGKTYLSGVARIPGVVKLPSGVMYRIISRAPGGATAPSPTTEDYVTIDYEGKLIDGKVFDSSYARHEAANFPLGQLVPAWQQVIPLMHVGDEVLLYTPPSEAYGDRDLSPDIPPDSTLIFRVHLIGIGPAQGGQ